jgi:hypothetical protein
MTNGETDSNRWLMDGLTVKYDKCKRWLMERLTVKAVEWRDWQ